MRRRIVVVGFTCACLCVLGGLFAWRRTRVAAQKPSVRPVASADIASHPALVFAEKQYRRRGAKYIWGANDCSAFVSDYLSRQSKTLKSRVTTWELAQIGVEKYGLVVAGDTKTGDVLNYRYKSQRREGMAGHCGVVLKKPDGFWVVHNCASMGLVIQRLGEFYATAKAYGVGRADVIILRPQT